MYPIQNMCSWLFVVSVMCTCATLWADDIPADYSTRQMQGWTIHIQDQLIKDDAKSVEKAMTLMDKQLKKVIASIPAQYVKKMQQVPIWFSVPYEGFRPTGAYHPNEKWLVEHGRHKELAKSIEFSNTHIFAKEIKRMPVMVIHELAHAYHDRELGFDKPEIIAAYREAKKSKKYEKVKLNNGRKAKAYALVNHKEYFAECTEAYFGENDFYPFNKAELADFDPLMYRVLSKIWAEKK